MFPKKLSIALAATFCILLGVSISASAADLRCFVNYEWEPDKIPGQFTMDVTMNTSFTGDIETDDGLTGNLFVFAILVMWDLERTTFYRGFALGPLAFGDMEDIDQRHGSWVAIIVEPSNVAADGGAILP